MENVELQLSLMDRIELTYEQELAVLLTSATVAMTANITLRGRGAEMPTTFARSLSGILIDLWLDSIRGAETVLPLIGVKSDIPANLLDEYLGNYGRLSSSRIIRTTDNLVLATILDGQRQGQSLASIEADLLLRAPNISALRARAIVATETHAAFQYGSQRLAEASGLVLQKQWNSINDNLTRDFGISGRVSSFNHRIMDGVRIPLKSSFQIPRLGGGVERLLFPGEPSGSAGNVMFCRCLQTYVRRA